MPSPAYSSLSRTPPTIFDAWGPFLQRDTRFASSESTQGYRLQIFGAFSDAHHACTRAWVLQRFSNIQRSPARHCFTALTCKPPRVEHRARLGACIRCGCDRFFGVRAREATGINPIHRVGPRERRAPGKRPSWQSTISTAVENDRVWSKTCYFCVKRDGLI